MNTALGAWTPGNRGKTDKRSDMPKSKTKAVWTHIGFDKVESLLRFHHVP